MSVQVKDEWGTRPLKSTISSTHCSLNFDCNSSSITSNSTRIVFLWTCIQTSPLMCEHLHPELVDMVGAIQTVSADVSLKPMVLFACLVKQASVFLPSSSALAFSLPHNCSFNSYLAWHVSYLSCHYTRKLYPAMTAALVCSSDRYARNASLSRFPELPWYDDQHQ